MRAWALLAMLLPAAALADGPPASGSGYTIESWTVDAGGGDSFGGDFEVRLTIGQYDADLVLSGADLEVEGGFWPATNNLRQTLFRSGFE